jgi:hypothetical protein
MSARDVGYQVLKGNGQWTSTFYAPAAHVRRLERYS